MNVELTPLELLAISPDRSGETGAECEILLPDYCPNVLRILQATAHPTVNATHRTGGRLAVEGSVEFRVLYLPEDGSGIRTVSYGSYYRCDGDEVLRENDVKCAAALSAPNIRVWAGKKGSGDASAADRAEVCANIRKTCAAAAAYGMTVSTEFHGGTLTDEYTSAVRLFEEAASDNFRLYWQPNQFRDEAYNLAALRAVLPYLSNVHVFTWSGHSRYPLRDGESLWRKYIDIIAADGRDHAMLLEFVCDDTEEQLYRDAETLHSWGIL